MSTITVDKLLENGVHYGHRASRWNPKMRPYIHGKRNDIHIIDLKQTVRGLIRSRHFLEQVVAEGGKVLWVGTKRSAKEGVRSAAVRTRQPFVTERWLGGTLTNFRTIRSRLSRLHELDRMEESGEMALHKKKEQARFRTEQKKLRKNLEGIKDLDERPACLVVVDPKNEHIAVAEANKMQIPVVALLDTDCDPDYVDIPIPANDDAMRSVNMLLTLLSEGVEEGNKRWAVVDAERQKAQARQRAEEDARKEQERQKRLVTEEWQRKLREDADRRRHGDAPGTPVAPDPAPAQPPAKEPAQETPEEATPNGAETTGG